MTHNCRKLEKYLFPGISGCIFAQATGGSGESSCQEGSEYVCQRGVGSQKCLVMGGFWSVDQFDQWERPNSLFCGRLCWDIAHTKEEEETGETETRDKTMKCWVFLEDCFDNFLTNSFSSPFLTCHIIHIDNSEQSHTSQASSIEEAPAVRKIIYFALNKDEQLVDR